MIELLENIDLYWQVLIFVTAYVIGSIPIGFLIVKLKAGEDLRQIGSGSTGATNVKRVLGTKYFFIVLLLDGFKGIIPVVLVSQMNFLGVGLHIATVLCALGLIIGHTKSIFLGFKGGKAVATGIGTILALNWIVGVSIIVVWSVVTFVSKYVSLGSVIAVIIAPVLMYFLHSPVSYVLYCIICASYVICLHKSNIQRLVAGTENKVRD